MTEEEFEKESKRQVRGRKILTEKEQINSLYLSVKEAKLFQVSCGYRDLGTLIAYGTSPSRCDWPLDLLSHEEIKELTDLIRGKLLEKLSTKLSTLSQQFNDL